MAVSSPRRSSDRRNGALLVVVLIAVMYAVEVVDIVLGGRLDGLGVEPRELDGLTGVALAPLLHSGFGHLLANTVPFAVLGLIIALGGLRRVVDVIAIVALVSGLATWLIGPEQTVHLGASGLVFGFATYVISRGVFTRRPWHIVGGILVAVIYGASTLIGLLPREGVSWQMHLFGAIGGVLAARLLSGQRPQGSGGPQGSGRPQR